MRQRAFVVPLGAIAAFVLLIGLIRPAFANAGDLVGGKTYRVSERLTQENWTTIHGGGN